MSMFEGTWDVDDEEELEIAGGSSSSGLHPGGGAPGDEFGGGCGGDGGGAPQQLTAVDYESLFRWPIDCLSQAVERLKSAGVWSDTTSIPAVVITTSYSGMGCAEAAVAMVESCLRSAGVVPVSWPGVRLHRAADKDPTCRRVLVEALKADHSAEHVMGDVLWSIPPDVQARILDYQKRLRQQVEVRKKALKGDPARSARDCSAMVREAGSTFHRRVTEMMRRMQVVEPLLAYCYRHDRMCPVFPERGGTGAEELHVEIAGTTCVAWSSLGGGEGWLHESALPCLAWVYDQMRREPDVIIHECTRSFDEAGLMAVLETKYDVWSQVITPTQFGVPSQRHRKYTLAVLRRRGGLSIPYASFAALFARTPTLVGDAYFQAPQRVRDSFARGLARQRQYSERAPGGSAWRVSEVLSPSLREMVRAYNTNKTAWPGRRCSIVDLSQNVARLGPGGPRAMMPALCRNSLMFHLESQQLLMPCQRFAVMGFPVVKLWPEGTRPTLPPAFFCFRWDIPTMLRRLERRPSQVMSLTGNGMHLSQIGLVFLFLTLAWRALEVEPRAEEAKEEDGSAGPDGPVVEPQASSAVPVAEPLVPPADVGGSGQGGRGRGGRRRGRPPKPANPAGGSGGRRTKKPRVASRCPERATGVDSA